MNTGQRISLIGHLGLIGLLLFGGRWNSEPLPFEVSDVSVISEADYEAALAAARAPQVVSEVAAPVPPQPENTPPLAAPQDAAVGQVDGVESPPPLVQPEQDLAVLRPGASPRPQLRPLERVAPEPVDADRPLDAEVAPEASPEAAPDLAAAQPAPQTEAAAPEAATTEINPEAADEVTLAPAQSLRPKGRPPRPDTPPAAEAPARSAQADVDAALAQALGAAEAGDAPSGPPLTSGEREGLKLAISRCYNVGALSSEALAVNIYLRVEMTRAGKPVINSITLLRSENGSEAAARQAYEAARRAIIICGNAGFDLPAEKYDQWKTVEIKFNPESMR